MTTITMEAVKARYPTPVTCNAGLSNPSAYCIGGAVISILTPDLPPVDSGKVSYWRRFPSTPDLAGRLADATGRACDECDLYAAAITHANDSRQFDYAWALLDACLTGLPFVQPHIDSTTPMCLA